MFFFFKQKTAYEMRISDWSSDVCSSDLLLLSEVGRINNIEVKPDEITKAMIEQARRFPGQERQVMEYFQKNPEAAQSLRAPIFEDKEIGKHTSELQSLMRISYAVFCLKKKKKKKHTNKTTKNDYNNNSH